MAERGKKKRENTPVQSVWFVAFVGFPTADRQSLAGAGLSQVISAIGFTQRAQCVQHGVLGHQQRTVDSYLSLCLTQFTTAIHVVGRVKRKFCPHTHSPKLHPPTPQKSPHRLSLGMIQRRAENMLNFRKKKSECRERMRAVQ